MCECDVVKESGRVYRIMGRCGNQRKEEIDTAETKSEAEYLLKEYKIAFGTSYSLWIE